MVKLLGKYIFGRNNKCLFSLNEEEDVDKQELIHGFIETIASFIAHFNKSTNFMTYSTETYQFSVLTLPTSYKIVLITTNTGRPKEYYERIMKQFYKDVYIELVVKNPVIKPGEEITSKLFRDQVIYYYASPSVGTNIQN